MNENLDMNYEEFITALMQEIGQELGTEYTLQRKKVIKNNAMELDGLVIRKENEHVMPSIYMNQYYEDYQNRGSIESIIEEILTCYEEYRERYTQSEGEIQYEYEKIKDSIFYRLVNQEMNEGILQTVPHQCFMDLCLTFHYLVREEENSIGTIMITNEHCDQWGIKKEELFAIAEINTPRLFPAVLRPMEDIMRDIMKQEIGKSCESDTDIQDAADEVLKMIIPEEKRTDMPMLVLTNKKGINGAACLLYPGMTKLVGDRLQNDYFILPSSIHELIIVPENDNLERGDIINMVREINATQVPEEEVLSGNVYYYYFKNGEMTQLVA